MKDINQRAIEKIEEALKVYKEEVKMTESEVKVLMSMCYRAGIKDGWDNKDLPTLKQLDDKVNEIYLNAMIAKQEDQYYEAFD